MAVDRFVPVHQSTSWIEVASTDPNIIYVGDAVGGVWKSDNIGTTWTPVFDTHAVASIGDLAIHPTNANIA